MTRSGKLRENEAEPAEGRDKGGDDGGAEDGDARRVAAVGAGFHVTAAAGHVAAMAEEVPEHHADQREDQPHHQTDSVDNHKPSLSCWLERVKSQPSFQRKQERRVYGCQVASYVGLIKHQPRQARIYNLPRGL